MRNKDRKKIKVLNVLTNINDGGLEILVYRIFSGLDKEIFDLNICTMTKSVEGFLLNQFKDVTSEIIELDFKNKKPGLSGLLQNLSNLFKLAKIIRKGKYDIVHSHDVFSPLVTRIALLMNKILFFSKPRKIYVTYHNVYYWLKPLHHRLNRYLSKFTDKIICVSKSVMQESLAKEKIKKDKYLVIYNGIEIANYYYNIDLRSVKRADLGYMPDDFVIGNVGVLSERKGQIYIVKAFNILKAKYPCLRLLLVGSKRDHELEYYNELMELVNSSKFKKDITISGTTKEINALYNVMDVFVMSSVTEGFGLAVYEAMLAERICVFSDIPVFKELITEAKTGLFFENKNYKSLSEVLERVYLNYKDMQGIALNGRNYTEKNFSLNKMVEQYDKLYRKSIND